MLHNIPFLKTGCRAAVLVCWAAALSTGDARKPTTAPATGPVTVRLTDAVPLAELQADEDLQVNLTDKLERPLASRTIYFGEIDSMVDGNDEPVGALPIIAIKDDDQWKAVPLTGRGLTDAGWRYVAGGPGRAEVWGVLDTVAGDSRANFVLAHSSDGGKSFGLEAVRKPARLAQVSDFVMDHTGRGRVTLSLDTDFGAIKAGLYHYETADDGKTWSVTPRYEPDAMLRAATVPDDEQPDAPPGKTRTGLHSKVHRHPRGSGAGGGHQQIRISSLDFSQGSDSWR